MATKNAANMFLSIQALSAVYPSTAHQSGETSPFVTIEGFEASGEGTRDITDVSLIAFTPLLKTQADLVTWNSYSANHSDWIAHGREFQLDSMFETIHSAVDTDINRESPWTETVDNSAEIQSDGDYQDHSDKKELSEEIAEYVYRIDSKGKPVPEDGSSSGPVAPIWQMSPVPPNPSMVNFNMASNSDFVKWLDYAFVTGEPILSGPLHAEDFFGPYVSGKGRPVSILLQPVFDKFAHDQDRTIVGTLVAMVHWEEFSNDVRGITARHTVTAGQDR
jgi:CHASE domain